MVHRSEGILQYGSGDRAVLLVDQGLVDYYRRLIPKYIDVRPQRHPAHVTVVRGGYETPAPKAWGQVRGGGHPLRLHERNPPPRRVLLPAGGVRPSGRDPARTRPTHLLRSRQGPPRHRGQRPLTPRPTRRGSSPVPCTQAARPSWPLRRPPGPSGPRQ